MAIRLTPRLLLVLEPVLESLSEGAASASNDRNFGDLGLSVETFFLTYNAEEHGLFVGKFNPLFGRAWDLAAGLYGSDFAEDYEITERLGIGGYFDLSPSLGINRLSASMFLADTTLLSETAFNNRGRFTRRLALNFCGSFDIDPRHRIRGRRVHPDHNRPRQSRRDHRHKLIDLQKARHRLSIYIFLSNTR